MDGLTYKWAPNAPDHPGIGPYRTPWQAFMDATLSGWTWGQFTVYEVGGEPVTADVILRAAPMVA